MVCQRCRPSRGRSTSDQSSPSASPARQPVSATKRAVATEAILADSKSGRTMRPLSQAACATLGQRGVSELVFPAMRREGPAPGFTETFRKIARVGGLPNDITPHTLRHSFASLAADLGYAEPTIAALVGHKG